ncbi:endonuclease III [Legionella anisa]|uniref:Endonuclease III n=1 Tax=Legionella anisa TaxID=28082 RepID=A0AAX0X1X8_9GAMM|nr:endonuclease III [Legionella anisa]AWN72743.1 endonuclease III [Legionella anisa]KTC72994.1 endonuclease III [Legionella anisa]MBN5935859.1 endonuclease III [Legionella anisa]MCW8423534.1 endonuclease III [Legionella anisa]MCW8447054.1 endonuclease III [Legionella anisa]
MNKQQRHEIFVRFRKQNPHPTTELVYHSAFELLIAVILSAQATDVGVNKATAKLFPVANTPQDILDLGEEKFKDYIKSIGLYNSKAQNIMKTCALLIKNYNGKVPNKRNDLESLPGVGRKTANVILNTAFGESTVAVDTHIFRVANRTGLAKGKTPLEVEKALIKNIAPDFLKDAHHWLVLHGRYVCTARRPQCKTCIIQDLCEYPDKNL